MCGIAGVFGKPDTGTVDKMVASIRHRGPDDTFLATGKTFSIGASRLSIIDIDGGRQPISNEDNSVWVVSNGEIYNFKSVRVYLEGSGHIFKTDTDTEVALHAYEEWGRAFVQMLDGMFAIAIWDDKNDIGILARDRVGKKPLYYTMRNDLLYFASEIKSLLQIPDFRREINQEALYHYLSYKHIPCPMSIFKGVQQLSPACMLEYKDGNTKVIKYWRLNYSVGYRENWKDATLGQLERAIRRRLVSDVPIGFMLSGGIDSSLVVALAADMSTKPLDTFTLTYKGSAGSTGSTGNIDNADGIDNAGGASKELDKELARATAIRYGTNHHEEAIDFPDFPVEFPRIIASFDEPFAGVTSTYFLARAIRKHVKVAITGDGADELFGSYLSHRMAAVDQADSECDWRYKLLLYNDIEKRQLLTPDAAANSFSTREHLNSYFRHLTAKDPLNRILEMEFGTLLPDQVLTFSDRLSMVHGLELRSPYLDTGMVELAATMPAGFKIRVETNTAPRVVTKYILKLIAKDYLDSRIITRPKEGFIMPVTAWLHGKTKSYVTDTLCMAELKKHGIFSNEYVDNLLRQFYTNGYDYRIGNKVLALLAFQVWYNTYIHGK